jgi:hypothetical protein
MEIKGNKSGIQIGFGILRRHVDEINIKKDCLRFRNQRISGLGDMKICGVNLERWAVSHSLLTPISH